LTRQLTGLAAGTADTDAVNVAQLKNVGVAVTGNTGSSDFLTDGGKLNVRGEGRVSVAASDDGAKDSKLTLKFDDTNLVKAGRNVTVDTSVTLLSLTLAIILLIVFLVTGLIFINPPLIDKIFLLREPLRLHRCF